ncbi:uncharacterized protein LOC129870615 [Solanum dulcamara]|uniref:uncharacterized protein LOC129870615 n=1 Tax=Solanum dulcamara TaxID=45834 RepID=UPI0024864BCC|nr:uncharacterized protein LOC129870615 [Solanum dulcamara]
MGECAIDFGRHWDKFLPLFEFSYNNSYHSNIGMAPSEALFGMGCRSPIGWFEAGEVQSLGVDLVRDAQDKVRSIQAKCLAARVDRRSIQTASKKSKLSPRYIGPFMILDCVGPVAYMLDLPPSLSRVHLVFHVSMLKNYHGDGDYIIKWDSVLLDKGLWYEEEPIAIIDCDIWKLRTKEIKLVNVQRKNHSIEKAAWETEKGMGGRYPYLFDDSATTLF